MKKFIAMLLVLVTIFAFAACGDDPPPATEWDGSIDLSNYAEDFAHTVWKNEGNNEYALSNSYQDTLGDFGNSIAQLSRTQSIGCTVKNGEKMKGKKVTKAEFEITADRDVEVTFWITGTIVENDTQKTVSLKANQKTKVEITTDCKVMAEKTLYLRVKWTRLSDATRYEAAFGYGTQAQADWSQTLYKVENFKLFCE